MSLGKIEEPEGGGAIPGGTVGTSKPFKTIDKKPGFWARLWDRIKRIFTW